MRKRQRFGLLCGVLTGSFALGGCVVDDDLNLFTAVATAPNQAELTAPPPIPSKMPWQLTPASTASVAQGEKTIIVADARFGRIKGTPIAVADLDKPLIAFAPRGPIVEACKQTIEPQAKSIGAYSVQAAAAGPARRDADGDRLQQVFFRIIYDRPAYLEVRQSALICKVDRAGQVIEARPV